MCDGRSVYAALPGGGLVALISFIVGLLGAVTMFPLFQAAAALAFVAGAFGLVYYLVGVYK